MEKFTPIQKQALGLYLHFRKVDPTILRLFVYNARLYLLLFLLGAPIVIAESIFVTQWFGWLSLAFIFGAISRDIGHFRKTVRNWALVREIIDWKKAEELNQKLSEHNSAP
jgi:hypothetical protein